MVGLGRMGANMTTRLVRGGHEVVVFDLDRAAIERSVGSGAIGAGNLAELVGQLQPPRAVWIMVPAGPVTATTVADLSTLLDAGDAIIDGGNSRFTDTVARATELSERGVTLLDAGTSGGIWGLEEGFCLMIGGEADAFQRLEPVFATLAPPDGYAHVGPAGSGHFVKMVHNGIEYGLMQAYAEGFELMRASDFDLDLTSIAQLWRRGSVVRSWLLDLVAQALEKDPDLAEVAGIVDDSGEGRWALETAIEHAVPTPAIAAALFARFSSRQDESYAAKMLAALRAEFGGHATHPPSTGDDAPS